MRIAAIVGAGLLFLAPASPPPVERAVPFKVGETLTYDVSWSSYLTAGTAVATIEAKQPAGNSLAYHIVAEGQPVSLVSKLYTLHYKADTLLDAYTLLPHRATVYIQEGNRKRTLPSEFDRKTVPAVVDPLSALYVLRASALKTGTRLTMPVVDNGVVYTVGFAVGAVENVKQGPGTVAAWKVAVTAIGADGQAAGRNMALWISTEQRRLPVKLQADLPVGDFSFLLREARP
jgi:hypothetical protein